MKSLAKLPLRPLDFLAVGLAILLTVASGFYVYAKPKGVAQVVIQGWGHTWVYPLDATETIEVLGPIGITVVRIEKGEAWVEDSPCENRTCVGSGHIHEYGQWIACLPNNVFVLIEGDEDDGKPDVFTW